MSEPQPPDAAPESPGPVRTWWHPMLVATLRGALADAYEVRDEVNVGRMPSRLDMVILRRRGDPPEIAHRELAHLLRLLNEVTALELKGPTDTLGPGDLDQFLGCVHLFRSQQRPTPRLGTLTAVILAPRLTNPFREDATQLGLVLEERNLGTWELTGGLFPLWILETDRLAETAETVLAFFSHDFLENPKPIIEHWRQTGHTAILEFVAQQIQRFKILGEAFIMQHKDTQQMEATWEEAENLVLSLASPEKRLEGLSAEDRLKGLSEDELRRLKQLLEERLPKNGQNHGDT